MDTKKLTEEEKKLLEELDDSLSDMKELSENFEKGTKKKLSEIEDEIENQKKDIDALEKDVISFEEENKDEIDSLAIKSILGE